MSRDKTAARLQKSRSPIGWPSLFRLIFMTFFSHSISLRCHHGFWLSLASFALVIGALLLLPADSVWLQERGRLTLALAPCAAFALGALAPSFKNPRVAAIAGAALGFILCAGMILAHDALSSTTPALSSVYEALAPRWIVLGLSLTLGFGWGLKAHHARFNPAAARPKTLRISVAAERPEEPHALRWGSWAQSTIPSSLWIVLPTDSDGLRLIEPLSGAVCSIERLVYAEPSSEESQDSQGSDTDLEEWIISFAWEPGFHPRRQWRGARADGALQDAQSQLLTLLLLDPLILSASAIS